jgi:hypothetical protein
MGKAINPHGWCGIRVTPPKVENKKRIPRKGGSRAANVSLIGRNFEGRRDFCLYI